MFLEGRCTLSERPTATQIEVTVDLTASQKVAQLAAIPLIAVGATLFIWMVLSREYAWPVLAVAVLLAGAYVALLVAMIRHNTASWSAMIAEDCALFESFIRRSVDARLMSEGSV